MDEQLSQISAIFSFRLDVDAEKFILYFKNGNLKSKVNPNNYSFEIKNADLNFFKVINNYEILIFFIHNR